MQVLGVDERAIVRDQSRAALVVFVYIGSGDEGRAVDSYLLTDADLPAAFAWLSESLPPACEWSLGVVLDPRQPHPDSDLDVAWIVGGDVLNIAVEDRSREVSELAASMVARGRDVPAL